MSEKRRVAITGLGVVSPVGIGQAAYWEGLLAPQPTEARRAHDFEPKDFYDEPKAIRRRGASRRTERSKKTYFC